MQQGWLDRNFKWVYTAPAVLFVLLMMGFPIVYTFRISFYEWSMSALNPPQWVGLSNYTTLFSDQRFWHAVGAIFYFTIAALFFETVLGVAIALLLNRDFKSKNFVKTIFLLPMVATPVAIGLVWLLIYEPTIGVANQLLQTLGLKPLEWLASTTQVIPSLVIIDVWEWTPMIALIVMAGLSTLPADPYEAADVDGATAWQKLRYITLPMLRPTIVVAVMLVGRFRTRGRQFCRFVRRQEMGTDQGASSRLADVMNRLFYAQRSRIDRFYVDQRSINFSKGLK